MTKSFSHLVRAGILTSLAVALINCPVRAENAAPSVEDRLAKIEAALAHIEKRLNDTGSADKLAPTRKEFTDLTKALGWDGKTPITAVKPAGKEKSLALGGFVQMNFESGGTNTPPDARFAGLNNRILLRRARIFVSGTYAEDISFKVESDFGANTLGNKTAAAGQLTDAYASWTKYPGASVRIGQFKTPFGYEQLASDTKIYTAERALPNDRLTLGRQVGAMAYGDLAEKRFSYSLAAFNGTSTNTNINDNQKFLWVGRAAGVLLDTKSGSNKVRLTAGVNYFTTSDKANTTLATTFTGRKTGTGVDAQLVFGPAEFQAEWLSNDLHPATGTATEATGWALLGAYSVTPKWQGIVRYETYDSNTATSNTTTNLWTFGVNYLIKGDDLKIGLNYLSGDQPSPAPKGDRLVGRVQFMF